MHIQTFGGKATAFTFDVTPEKSAHFWNDVRFIGPDQHSYGNKPSCGTRPSCESNISCKVKITVKTFRNMKFKYYHCYHQLFNNIWIN